MKLPPYLRVLLGVVLLGCGWLFWQDLNSPTPPDIPVPAPVQRAPDALPQAPSDGSAPAPATTLVDLFPAQSWLPPPPPVEPTKPAAPQAPPMPFTVSAQWRYQGQSKIVVLQGQGVRYTLCKSCSVEGHIRPGATFDKGYRLDKLTDTSVVLMYLPLRQVTTLRLDTP
ncbi:hypothetical protein [Pseudomonas gingeri]|uniref:hypothetical protein n=1 Tax=Pseudomonas gingeri TaxID=117681 RepID=UPI0015A42D47|nr:hypothetical protein [Pseudomonas gingeri]NWD50503.1 hypothetical protein [Pseudomonas gingeri]NWE34711.1 hypothetical protein [Pseudomonas gingeri]NWE60144.1 hypothetical protein [Pseudomonas gingeri]NWF05899.1 hypothetical protein [Pseudomonas gingeri]